MRDKQEANDSLLTRHLRFTWCMNSGALAELTHQCPYHFSGLDIIADIFFLFSLTLYTIFSLLFILRFLWFGKTAYQEITGSFAELTFVSCWLISFMTLTSDVALIVSTASWGGYPFTMVAYVMWWFVMIWNMASLLWVFITLIRQHNCTDTRLGTSIIIPAVSVSTVGVTGAVVATYAEGLSSKLAVPVMVVSFNWVGVGILMGMVLIVILFHTLLAQGWPPPPATPSMFIFIGPMGQSAACLQILGTAARQRHRFADYNAGFFLTAESAAGVDAACTVLALLLNGFGVILLCFAIAAMVDRAIERTLTWTPSWNAIIFPTATLTTSMLMFATQMDSPAYRVVTTGLTIVLIIFFLVNLVMTILRISQGKLLIVREDYRVKQQMMDQQKER